MLAIRKRAHQMAASRRKWLALALLCTVQFMVVLDIAIVNVALPSIQTDLGFSQENLQWVISAYALFFGGFLLLGGRAADLLGRRRVFLAGLVVFGAASLLSGLAWSEGALIGSRALQGLGSAIVPGAALVTGGLVVLVYALTQANGAGWGSAATVARLAGAIALLAAFGAWER